MVVSHVNMDYKEHWSKQAIPFPCCQRERQRDCVLLSESMETVSIFRKQYHSFGNDTQPIINPKQPLRLAKQILNSKYAVKADTNVEY